MKRIGITGPTGSGKTTALGALKRLGVWVLDTDAIYHELLAGDEGLKGELRARFGEEIMDPAGQVDRKKLGSIVFADPAALRELNAITHRRIGAEVERRSALAEAAGAPGVAIDAISLIESGLGERCDVVVAVIAPARVRIRRIMARDGIPEEYARSRVLAQQPDEFYLKNSDHTFVNDSDLSPQDFEEQALAYFQTILE